MFPFSKLPPFDATERKALLLAIIGSLLFLSFLVSISPRNHASSAPIPPKTVPAKPAPAGDSFAIYRIKPEQFYDVDFWNYYYGRYTLHNGKKIHLNLTNSQLESLDGSDRFALKDVYYRDVTGDGEPEAIVWLLHVHCAGSCDGGSNLFYIYTVEDHELKPIWQYETGSYAYGCGLKSITISGRQIVLELFGHCTDQKMEDRGPSKFAVDDSTFILLEFDGRGFRERSSEIIETEPTTVKSFEPGIRIF